MGRMMRGAGALIALLLIAAAVAAGVILLTGDSTGVKLKEVGGDSVNRVVDELRSLVQDNTQ
jgi:archaellin